MNSDVQKQDATPIYQLRMDLIGYRGQRRKQCLKIGAFCLFYAYVILYIGANFGAVFAPLFRGVGAHNQFDTSEGLALLACTVAAFVTPELLMRWIDDVSDTNKKYKHTKIEYEQSLTQLRGGELSSAQLEVQQGELTQSTQPGQLTERS